MRTKIWVSRSLLLLVLWSANFFLAGSQMLSGANACVSCIHWSVSGTSEASVDGIELLFMIVGAFGQALAGQSRAVSILGVLIFWRFVVLAFSDLPPSPLTHRL